MREILTEFDELQEAMKRVNLNEEVMPIYAGKVLVNENAESYKKMQQILDCEEMHSAHKYILNLNPEQMSDEEMEQVDKIYRLGVNRGFLTVGQDQEEGNLRANANQAAPAQDACTPTQKPATRRVKIPCWTVMYSAFKNGEIKTGECYSNSIDARSAKADCLAKLARCGYDNVSILALEQGDPDSCGFEDYCYSDNNDAKCSSNDLPATKKDCSTSETGEPQNVSEEEEAKLGDYVLTLEISDIDPESFLKGHVDQWIESTLEKNPGVKIDKLGQRDVGVEVKVTGPYEQLEQIYADYVGYDNLYYFEKSPADFDEFNASLEKVDESDSKIEESENPYAANVKTTDVGGATVVGGSKPKKKAPAKDAVIDEDDEDGEEGDDSSSDESSDDSSDDSSEEESSGDDSSDDDSSDDDSGESDDTEEDSGSDDDSGDDDSEDSTEDSDTEDSDDDSDDSSDDSSDDEGSDDDSDDSEDSEDSEEGEDSEDDDSGEEDSEEDDSEEDSEDDSEEDSEGDDKKEELSDEEKTDLKNEYKKTFKEILFKCKFDDLCFDDLSIQQKVKFFTELGKKWKKNEPQDFMSDKEIEQLNKVVAKK